MCTIMCYTGTDMKHEKFAGALQRTESIKKSVFLIRSIISSYEFCVKQLF